MFSQEVVHHLVVDAVSSDSLVGHSSGLADAFLRPLFLRALVLKPLYVVLPLVLKTSLSATRREAAKTIRRIRCSPREENGEAAKRTFLMTYTLM